ncbi:ABC-F family ATP-binding cassette domain-containing protein [Marinithermus hydrothermalis]|uniref:ABC transporter related protein n=1 Tax=Marinithermus hydrothermalis (strain DSM 14884 / JCM 11576 / T1) TaxID=869210 RepID=F2NQU0_MARHT|nr:ABC-F family ATP-binding cassette domain-containing protein [Marinithermus hydrothermalis]AEB12304.1 ABC transporter related protein [Marinithermus hydrothermalis DSM 14884]
MRIVTLEAITYTVGGRDLFQDVRFELRTGERVALVGPNGAGKTTLLRILLGELEPSAGRVIRAPQAHLAALAQDPIFLPGQTVAAVLKQGFARLEAMEKELATLEPRLADPEVYARWEALHARFEAGGGYTRRARYEAVLKGLGFAGREEEEAARLSGGEARRLALGAALLSGADALLLDEPTNHLDLEMRDWLAEFLRGYGGALLFVSHDRAFMDRVAQKTALLQNGRLQVYEGGYTAFRAARARELEAEVAAWKHWAREKARLEASLERTRRWAATSAKQAARKDALEARLERHLAAAPPEPPRKAAGLRIRFPATPSGERVLEARWLVKAFGARRLFSVEHLVLRRGERVALVGPNGAGKTTFLKVLLGLLASDDPRGTVRFGARVVLGYYDQRLSGVDPERTLFETLYDLVGERKAHDLLGAWRFPYAAQFKKVRDLSGGERARLMLLLLALKEANLLVLDEPTNHLDLETIEALEAALAAYAGTLIVVSHDRAFLDRVATRTWRLGEGRFDDHPAPPSEALARLRSTPQTPPTAPQKPRPARRRGKSRWHTERALERLEAEIAALEARGQALAQEANTPGLSPEAYARIAREQAELERALAERYARWEALAAELEG